MPVELLVSARDGQAPFEKGDIVVAKDSPAIWGGKEGLPDFIRITISDATLEQVQPYLDEVVNILQNDPPEVVAGKRRVRLFVDPGIAGKIPDAQALKSELWAFFRDNYDAELISIAPREAVIAFPLSVSLADVRRELTDKFDERVFERRYHFDATDVDLIVAGTAPGQTEPGLYTITRQQVMNNILDRKD